MMDGTGGDEIRVRGGRGGILVSLDRLESAGGRLAEAADAVGGLARRTRRLDLLTLPILTLGSSVSLARLDTEHADAAAELSRLARGLERHASDTVVAVGRYRLAEWDARASAAVAGVLVPGVLELRLPFQQRLGWFRDLGRASVEALPVDPETAVQMWDVASIVTSQSLLSGDSAIRVIEQPQPDGTSAWIVQIPGTLSWNPRAGEVPNDLTADLELMALQQAALTAAALAALRAAQRSSGRYGSGDPVMLTGHSLGGIAAAAITTDPAARTEFNLTHVVSVGSPIGYLPVPDDIEVLSFEHEGDSVTDLDLVPNPDRTRWTTVTRDASGARLPVLGLVQGDHDSIGYRETARLAAIAVEDRSNASLVHWAASAAPFFRGGALPVPTAESVASPEHRARQQQERGATKPQTVRDYRARRGVEEEQR